MAQLIDQVRRMIGDPGAMCTPYWTDDQIQDELDKNREDFSELELTPMEQVNPVNRYIRWYAFYANWGMWEADYQLQDHSWQWIRADQADLLLGRWFFKTSQFLPVFVTGKSYDVNSAAANLLDAWSASFMTAYDVSTDLQRFSRSQIFKNMQCLACIYRRQGRISEIRTYRSDSASAGYSPRWVNW
jgi:hypothetical protein